MKKLGITATNLLITMFIVSALVLVSCRKEHNYDGIVSVTDTLDVAVPGAIVYISGENSTPAGNLPEIMKEGETDNDGNYRFSINLPAILKVKVVKDSLKGQGTIKIEENKLGKTTIIVKK